MHKILSAQSQRWDTAVIVSLDAANAFNTISRPSVRRALVERVPKLARACGWWYARDTTHVYWDEMQRACPILAERGVDQGCALSPALFAIALAPQLQALEQALRVRDDRACACILG